MQVRGLVPPAKGPVDRLWERRNSSWVWDLYPGQRWLVPCNNITITQGNFSEESDMFCLEPSTESGKGRTIVHRRSIFSLTSLCPPQNELLCSHSIAVATLTCHLGRSVSLIRYARLCSLSSYPHQYSCRDPTSLFFFYLLLSFPDQIFQSSPT